MSNDMKDIKAGIDQIKQQYPNFVDIAAQEVFRPSNAKSVADPIPTRSLDQGGQRTRRADARTARACASAFPRVLNIYTYAPLFNAYLESLGVQPENIVYSDYTSSELYRAGASRGAIDPCFPAKIGISHVYNLIQVKHRKKPLDVIFFPMYDVLTFAAGEDRRRQRLPHRDGDARNGEGRLHQGKRRLRRAQRQVRRPDPEFRRPEAVRPPDAPGLAADSRPVARKKMTAPSKVGFQALADYESSIRRRARQVLDQLEREDRIGIVMLGRPYHHDPGLNHEILEEFQKLGYPIFSQNTLPLDEDLLERLFGEEVRAGVISHALDISDAWKNSYSCSTNHKIWAAKFTARHPNLVALEMSSFKCGHDAPIYGVIEGIIEQSGTPYFCFKDLDENKPAGSIRIRVETIDYFLRRYREEVIRKRKAAQDIEAQLAALEAEWRSKLTSHPANVDPLPFDREAQEMTGD